MIREFEGKSEKEAIDIAVAEMGLKQGEFDVEIVETIKKSGLFRKKAVKIRVHTFETEEQELEVPEVPEDKDLEEKLIVYLEKILDIMGFPGKAKIFRREERKIYIDIESVYGSILIGRKGKNLDALQLITTVYAGRLGSERKVILDLENYRIRREENLVRMARKISEEVQKTRRSQLLEPMNPFERRLIHIALGGMENIDTKSEGEGPLKQVRIIYKG